MTQSQEAARYFSDANLCDEEIEEVDVTYGFVVEKLIQGWPKFQETVGKGVIKTVTLEKTTSIGCKPNMFRFIATFSTDEVLSAVIKVTSSMTCAIPGMTAAKSKDAKQKHGTDVSEEQRKSHDCEAEFYQRFGGKSAIPGFPVHKIYYSRKFSDNQPEDEYIPPMLIMEDLTQVTHVDEPIEFGDDQVQSIVKGLASLHKHTLCMGDDNWKNSFTTSLDNKFAEKIVPLVDKGTGLLSIIGQIVHRKLNFAMTQSQEAVRYFSDANLCDEEIEEVDVTYGFVVEKLIQGWPKFQQTAEKGVIKTVTLEKTTSIGCKPNMFRFIATFSTDEVLSAVIKVTSSMTCAIPGIAKPKDAKANRDKDISEPQRKSHDCEAEFYQRFGGKSAIPGFPVHKIYYSRKFSDNQPEDEYIPPMLIMEDLTQVTHLVGVSKEKQELSEDQVKSIVKSLASLHKHFLCLEDDKWKDILTVPNTDKMIVEKMAPSADKGIEYFGDIYRRLQRTMTGDFVDYATKDFSLEIGLPEMLVHGLNPASVLFSNAEPSSIAAFADFQLISLGSPAIDLERFITLTSYKYKDDPEAKSKFETDTFEYYYEVLSQKMREEGHELTFTRDQLKRSYQLCKVVGVLRNMIMYAKTALHLSQMPASVSEEHMKTWKDYAVAGGNEAVQILQQEAPEWLDE